MRIIPIFHGLANAGQHIPCRFVGHSNLRFQLQCRNSSLIVCHEIHRQEPFGQRCMSAMHNCTSSYTYLMSALLALIFPVRQFVRVVSPAFRTYEPIWPAERKQMLSALFFGSEPLDKFWKRHFPFLCHLFSPFSCFFPYIIPLFVIWVKLS